MQKDKIETWATDCFVSESIVLQPKYDIKPTQKQLAEHIYNETNDRRLLVAELNDLREENNFLKARSILFDKKMENLEKTITCLSKELRSLKK
jgi:hypothetical protein